MTKRNRTTWRLSDGNFDWLEKQRKRLGIASLNETLNVVLHSLRIEEIEQTQRAETATTGTVKK